MEMTRSQLQFLNPTPVLFLAQKFLIVLIIMAAVSFFLAQPEALALSVSPSSLSFAGAQGSTNPPAQTVTFRKGGDRTKSWTVSAAAPWISVTPSAGTISTEQDQLAVSVNLGGLSAGSYSSSITILTEGFKGRTNKTTIPLSLSVTSSTSTPTIRLSPTALSFSGIAGGANPAAQSLNVTNPTGGTLSWSLSDNAAWLTLSAATGTTTTETDTLSASVNLTGLAAGTYTAAITVSATGASNTPQVIPVSLAVTASTTTPVIGLSTTSLAFTGTAGGTNPANQSFTVSNTGSGTLTWTANDNAAWLTLSPVSGTNTGAVAASVNLTGLAAGTYSGAITVAATGATSKTLPVSLTINPAPTATPVIGLSTTGLTFNGTAGGSNPATQSFTVSNTGSGTLTWTASDNAAWLALSPVSGTNAGTVSASVNLSGLAAGTYNATVTLAATGATTKTVPVTLVVTAPTAGGTISFTPTTLSFSGSVGGSNPASKAVSLTNPGSGTLTWTMSDDAAWLTVTPVSGTTTTETDTLTASVNLSGLAAGTYTGLITITASGSSNSPKTIPVTLTLTAPSAGTATLTWSANAETDLVGYKVYRGTASGTYGAPVATLSKTATSYAFSGLQTGTTYFFVVTAYDSAGNESPFSNEVSKSIF